MAWLSINVITFGLAVRDPEWLRWLATAAGASAVFVFGTWLWRWYVSTPCGIVSGALIMFVTSRNDTQQAAELFIALARSPVE